MICGFQGLPLGDFRRDLKVTWISSKSDEKYLNRSEVVGSPSERFILDSGLWENFLKSTELRSCSMNLLSSLLISRKDKFPFILFDQLFEATSTIF